MCQRHSVNCIVPPHMLRKLLDSSDPKMRAIALATMLASTAIRAERKLVAKMGFLPNIANERRRTIYDCKGRRILEESDLSRGENDPEVGDIPTNSAFDGLGATFDFFKDILGRNSLDDRGMRLDGYVHYGHQYNNAFWDGREMVFGDGDGEIFTDFTGSLDVIAHELTHGVTEFAAGLKYEYQSGALNESVSDVFGSLVKQWKKNQTAAEADWLIGDDIFTPNVNGDALRSMKAPGQAYDDPNIGRDPQPAHMDNYQDLPNTEEGDYGGVHINSGIPNHAFYLTATAIGGNAWLAPGHIWYEALKSSSPNTDFKGFAEKTYQAADALYGSSSTEKQAVYDAWDQVGVRMGTMIAAPAPSMKQGTPRLNFEIGTSGDGRAAFAELSKRVQQLSEEVNRLKRDRSGKKSHVHV